MVNLGNSLANRVDPPELEEARGWYPLPHRRPPTPATNALS